MSPSPLYHSSHGKEEGGKKAYGVFVGEDLPHVEDAARDVRDGFAAEGDARGAVVPGPADVELDVSAVGLVLEGDG